MSVLKVASITGDQGRLADSSFSITSVSEDNKISNIEQNDDFSKCFVMCCYKLSCYILVCHFSNPNVIISNVALLSTVFILHVLW